MSMHSKILSKTTLSKNKIYKILKFYVVGVQYTPDLTQEILIVFDEYNWLNIFWNPIRRDWEMTKYENKWELPPVNFGTDHLLKLCKCYKKQINEIFALQYKTISGVKIFLNSN